MTPGTGTHAGALYVGGNVVAAGSPEALTAVARLFGVACERLCITPSGHMDAHGKYVDVVDGKMSCAFCARPLVDDEPPRKLQRAPSPRSHGRSNRAYGSKRGGF